MKQNVFVLENSKAEDAIFEFAKHYFTTHGADNGNADHLIDHIYAALDKVEKEEAFSKLTCLVERAFNRLRINGYRCEQNWECCMTCGWAMIPDEDADHAVWYHSQDADFAIETGRLRLVWQGDAALIRECLEAEGLLVEHDGTVGQRIEVEVAS